MKVIVLIIIGVLGGIAGGMGLGGGTILVPLVSIFLGVAQKQAQFLNVFTFVIMAFIIIFFHIKNKLVDVFLAVFCSFIGVLFSIISSLVISRVSDGNLKTYFGVFLIVLGVAQLFSLIISKYQKKNNNM